MQRNTNHPYLHSFPTRRSSDLVLVKENHFLFSVKVKMKNIGQINIIMHKRIRVLSPKKHHWQFFHQSQSKIRIRKRSEEHTSELQSRPHLVCRLLLEKKKTRLNPPSVFTLITYRSLGHGLCPPYR